MSNTESSYGAWHPPQPTEEPTIVGYAEGYYVWFDEHDVQHPGRCAILSNGMKVVVRDDRKFPELD